MSISIQRFVRSIPAANIGILVTLGLAVYGFYGGPKGSQALTPRDILFGFLIFALVTLYQTYLNYQRAKYDTTIAMRYEAVFADMGEERAAAAKALRAMQAYKDNSEEVASHRHHGDLSPIDEVLDFLDTIGFLCHGDQISSDVAHHYFYHWIRRYWVLAQPYVGSYRTVPGEDKAYSNVEDLFQRTCCIELVGTDRTVDQELTLTRKQINDFLDDEEALGAENGASSA